VYETCFKKSIDENKQPIIVDSFVYGSKQKRMTDFIEALRDIRFDKSFRSFPPMIDTFKRRMTATFMPETV
jgi:hypothetical protein